MSIEAAPHATARSIWTRLTVDPVVVPLASRIAPWAIVTPNRVTGLAGVLAVGASVAFVTGQLRLGGVLFILRYAIDCLDGQVARVQAKSSTAGAALDIAVDVVGISAAVGSLSWYLIEHGHLAVAEALLLMGNLVVYNWVLAYRKSLAKSAGLDSDGGAGGTPRNVPPGLHWWFRWCRRIGMSPLPWAVEAEILALGLGPLLLPERYTSWGLDLAIVFYVLANLTNLRRVRRIAGSLDRRSSTNPKAP